MNKLLKSVSDAVNNIANTNENRISATPDQVNVNVSVDIDTWRYFENLDEDSRQMMASVLQDYVQKQR